MTLYGYARVSVREPEDKNLDLQVEQLVRAGCSMGNIRAEEASGAKDDRGGLLELLDLVVASDTLVVTHREGHGTIRNQRERGCPLLGVSRGRSRFESHRGLPIPIKAQSVKLLEVVG